MIDTPRTRIRHLLLAAVFLSNPALAGTEVWSDAAVEVRVADDWRIGTETSVRTPVEAAPVQYNQDLLAEYKASKWLKLGAAYRFQVRDWLPVHTRHRLGLDQTFRLLKDPLKLQLRLRETLRVPTVQDDAKLTLRPRLKVAIPLDGPLEPFASTEVFIEPLENDLLDKLRTSVGVDFELGDVAEATVQYRLEQSLSAPDPWVHIIGVGVKFDVDARRED